MSPSARAVAVLLLCGLALLGASTSAAAHFTDLSPFYVKVIDEDLKAPPDERCSAVRARVFSAPDPEETAGRCLVAGVRANGIEDHYGDYYSHGPGGDHGHIQNTLGQEISCSDHMPSLWPGGFEGPASDVAWACSPARLVVNNSGGGIAGGGCDSGANESAQRRPLPCGEFAVGRTCTGSWLSNPPDYECRDIVCPPVCTSPPATYATYPGPNVGRIAATPLPGYRYAGWDGCDEVSHDVLFDAAGAHDIHYCHFSFSEAMPVREVSVRFVPLDGETGGGAGGTGGDAGGTDSGSGSGTTGCTGPDCLPTGGDLGATCGRARFDWYLSSASRDRSARSGSTACIFLVSNRAARQLLRLALTTGTSVTAAFGDSLARSLRDDEARAELKLNLSKLKMRILKAVFPGIGSMLSGINALANIGKAVGLAAIPLGVAFHLVQIEKKGACQAFVVARRGKNLRIESQLVYNPKRVRRAADRLRFTFASVTKRVRRRLRLDSSVELQSNLHCSPKGLVVGRQRLDTDRMLAGAHSWLARTRDGAASTVEADLAWLF